jgi:signal peptidase I
MKASASTRQWIAKLLILSAVAIIAVLGIAYITLRVCFPAFLMSSGSMENTLVKGDTVLVNRLDSFRGRAPQRGELVVFHWPLDRKQIFLERMAGVPGDRLKVRDKKLFRNGAEVSEPYVQHSTSYMDPYRDNFPSAPNFPLREPAIDMLENHVVNGEVVVPEGRYFVMGDNRDDSADSRYFGFVERGDIIGRPFVIVYSRDPKRAWKRLY